MVMLEIEAILFYEGHRSSSVRCSSDRDRFDSVQSHAISASSYDFYILAVSIFNMTEHIYRSSAQTYIDLLRSYAKLDLA